MNVGDLWPDAHVGFPDWSGSAQLDQRRTGPDANLEKLIGLDPDEWMIVGINVNGGERKSGRHHLHVVAVRLTDLPSGTVDDANVAEIPVTDFLVHDIDPYDILRTMIHQFDLRLRHRGWGELPLRVVAFGDVPAQESPETED